LGNRAYNAFSAVFRHDKEKINIFMYYVKLKVKNHFSILYFFVHLIEHYLVIKWTQKFRQKLSKSATKR
ncbi:MAG: hypothetical protein EBU93_07155, partial [Chlamydiae bacterium]|nr:hypothetical protein [Chlamydiota bacterium]